MLNLQRPDLRTTRLSQPLSHEDSEACFQKYLYEMEEIGSSTEYKNKYVDIDLENLITMPQDAHIDTNLAANLSPSMPTKLSEAIVPYTDAVREYVLSRIEMREEEITVSINQPVRIALDTLINDFVINHSLYTETDELSFEIEDMKRFVNYPYSKKGKSLEKAIHETAMRHTQLDMSPLLPDYKMPELSIDDPPPRYIGLLNIFMRLRYVIASGTSLSEEGDP